MGFIRYYQKGCDVKLVDKQRSLLMKLINVILLLASKMKLASISNFMSGYVTTIGKSIYSTPVWTPDMRAKPIVVHELAHVEQWSFKYAMKYIFSPKFRLRAESISIQAEMLCFPENFRNYSQLEARALRLYNYGIQVYPAMKELRERQKEVESGTPILAAQKVFVKFKGWKSEYPNAV